MFVSCTLMALTLYYDILLHWLSGKFKSKPHELSPHICQCHFNSVQLLSHVRPCKTMDCSMPGFPVHHQLPKLARTLSIELVMASNHFIFCCPLLLLPSIFPSIRVFSNESVLHIRWPKYCNFNFSTSPSSEYWGLISFRIDWLISLQSKGLSRVFSNTTVLKHQFCCFQLSL